MRRMLDVGLMVGVLIMLTAIGFAPAAAADNGPLAMQQDVIYAFTAPDVPQTAATPRLVVIRVTGTTGQQRYFMVNNVCTATPTTTAVLAGTPRLTRQTATPVTVPTNQVQQE